MYLRNRTRISLSQFLLLSIPSREMMLLLTKYDMETHLWERETKHGVGEMEWNTTIVNSIVNASPTAIEALLHEIVKTRYSLQNNFSRGERSVFDERWEDLVRCLQLDGYGIARDEHGGELDRFVPIEPIIEGANGAENDLTRELKQANLPEEQEILERLDATTTSFRGGDFNGCLTNARVALQALATAVAKAHRANCPGAFDEEKWGEVVAYLRKSEFINRRQEEGLTGVFSFLSQGAHVPIGFTEGEFARLGRNLAVSFCYFLIKLQNRRRATASV